MHMYVCMHVCVYMSICTCILCVYVCKFAGVRLNVANMRKVKGYLQGRHLTTAWLQHLRKCLLQ